MFKKFFKRCVDVLKEVRSEQGNVFNFKSKLERCQNDPSILMELNFPDLKPNQVELYSGLFQYNGNILYNWNINNDGNVEIHSLYDIGYYCDPVIKISNPPFTVPKSFISMHKCPSVEFADNIPAYLYSDYIKYSKLLKDSFGDGPYYVRRFEYDVNYICHPYWLWVCNDINDHVVRIKLPSEWISFSRWLVYKD